MAIDYWVVECTQARDAISAQLDGEDPGVPVAALADHLGRCGACREWQDAAHAVTRSARLGSARIELVGADELVASVLARSRPPRWPTSLTWIRVGLVAVAVAQAAVALPLLVAGHDHAAPEHVAHEMGAFAMALAVGFVLAAWKPDRARGMHGLVGVAALLLVVTAVIDLAHGRTGFGDESPHLLAVIGWLLLARIAAATPSPVADTGWSRPPVARPVRHRRPAAGGGIVAPVARGGRAGGRVTRSEPKRRAG